MPILTLRSSAVTEFMAVLMVFFQARVHDSGQKVDVWTRPWVHRLSFSERRPTSDQFRSTTICRQLHGAIRMGLCFTKVTPHHATFGSIVR